MEMVERLGSILWVIFIFVGLVTSRQFCDKRGLHCEDIEDGLNAEAIQRFSKWWEEMSVPRPLKKPCHPPFHIEFQKPHKPPIVDSFPCLGQPQIYFEFSGLIDENHLFQGPGKLTILKTADLGTEPKHSGTCIRYRKTGIILPQTVLGSFKDGKPEGVVKIEGRDGSFMIGELVQGIPHGFVRVWNEKKQLIMVDYTFHADLPFRGWAQTQIGDNFLYRRVPLSPEFLQNNDEDLDLGLVIHNHTAALVGDDLPFHAKLEQALFVKIDSFTEANCLLIPDYSVISSKPFTFGLSDQSFEFTDYAMDTPVIPCSSGNSQKTPSTLIRDYFNHFQNPFNNIRGPKAEATTLKPLGPGLLSNIQHLRGWNFSCLVLDSQERVLGQLRQGKVDYKNQIHGAFSLEFDPDITPQLAPFHQGIRKINGYFKQGQLLPSISLEIKDGTKINTHIQDGVLQGTAIASGQKPWLPLAPEYNVTNFQDSSSGIDAPGLRAIYHYERGSIQGPVCFVMYGGGFLYGPLDRNGQFTGDDIAYVYPDYETAYVGRFEDRLMKAAQEVTVTGLNSGPEGLMKLEFSPSKGPIVFYSPPTNVSFGGGPQIPDPFEAKMVKVRPSRMVGGGEGVFALKDIPEGRIACLYSGYLYRNQDEQEIYALKYGANESLSDDRRRHGSKYSIRVAFTQALIQIPWEVDQPDSWQPTRAQKINCDFVKRHQNCGFMQFEHPRYGMIVAAKTVKDVKKGEELFIDYGYTKASFPADFLWYHEHKAKYLTELESEETNA